MSQPSKISKYSVDLLFKMITLGRALLTGKNVSPERMKKRMEICLACPNVRFQGDEKNGLPYCGICQCQLKADRGLINLTRYEEVSGKLGYGCHHVAGSRWKAGGV